MFDINVFKNSKMRMIYEQPSSIISWITILFIFLFLFVMIGFSYHFNVYGQAIGYVDINDSYNLKVIINKDMFPLKKSYELYIEGKKYNYKIVDTKEIDGYYQLLIYCNMDDELLIKNNIITINFKKYQTTLITEILKKIKKGMI